jgi:hypothetical protein
MSFESFFSSLRISGDTLRIIIELGDFKASKCV